MRAMADEPTRVQGTLRARRTGPRTLGPGQWLQPNDISAVAGTATTRIVRARRHAPATGAVVSFSGVEKRYSATDVALDGISFDIYPGEFVFLVGASGSGKSTTMRLLIKESEPTGGEIRVAGRDLQRIPRGRVPYYRRNLGVIFQDYKLLPNRTVYENVAYALQVTGGGRREIRDKVPDILRLTGLSTKLHNYPDQLSGGEQQRVAIARAFVNHPPLLIADEPTGNLDPETSIGIMQLLYRINQTGTTVLVATHDVAMVDKMRRRVIELSEGKIVRDEQARRLRGAREHARVRGPHAGSARLRPVFFLREALRALKRNAIPSFAAMATVLVTVLVLGVFIPVVQATTGAANEVRGKVIADVYLKTDVKQTDIDRVGRLLKEQPLIAKSEFISKEQAYKTEKARNPKAYELLGSNPLPDTYRITPEEPRRHRQDQGRAQPAGRGRRAHRDRPGDRRGPQPRRRHATRSSA